MNLSGEMYLEQTPDPCVKDMLESMADRGCETAFDRFDAQQPQCGFGISGVCCRICVMGPCKITAKCPRGVCGADADGTRKKDSAGFQG